MKLSKQISEHGHTYYINCSISALPSNCIVLPLQCLTIWTILRTLCLLRVACRRKLWVADMFWLSERILHANRRWRRCGRQVAILCKGRVAVSYGPTSPRAKQSAANKARNLDTRSIDMFRAWIRAPGCLLSFCTPLLPLTGISSPHVSTWLNVTGHVTYIVQYIYMMIHNDYVYPLWSSMTRYN